MWFEVFFFFLLVFLQYSVFVCGSFRILILFFFGLYLSVAILIATVEGYHSVSCTFWTNEWELICNNILRVHCTHTVLNGRGGGRKRVWASFDWICNEQWESRKSNLVVPFSRRIIKCLAIVGGCEIHEPFVEENNFIWEQSKEISYSFRLKQNKSFFHLLDNWKISVYALSLQFKYWSNGKYSEGRKTECYCPSIFEWV